MKKFWAKTLSRKLDRKLVELDDQALAASAIVFTPHPDDETLACGGTIARKIKARADLQVVAMTDGRHSHGKFIAPEEMKDRRAGELVAAMNVLGVAKEAVTFLEYEDNALWGQMDQAVEKVAQLLADRQPEQVFIPYRLEIPDDHKATTMVVRRALQRCQLAAMVYEYPVWFWYHWPWVSRSGSIRKKMLIKNSLRSLLGLRLTKDFCYAVTIADELKMKQQALQCYESQMKRPKGRPDWPILADVGAGDFLDCFYHNREIFAGYPAASI